MVQRRSYLSLESNILRPINLTRYTTLKAPIKVLGFILSHIKIYTDAPYFCWQEMQNQKAWILQFDYTISSCQISFKRCEWIFYLECFKVSCLSKHHNLRILIHKTTYFLCGYNVLLKILAFDALSNFIIYKMLPIRRQITDEKRCTVERLQVNLKVSSLNSILHYTKYSLGILPQQENNRFTKHSIGNWTEKVNKIFPYACETRLKRR